MEKIKTKIVLNEPEVSVEVIVPMPVTVRLKFCDPSKHERRGYEKIDKRWHVQELICHEHVIEGRHVPANYIQAAREAAQEALAKAKEGEYD
tara:strand:+ start:555 stop:830 length:276 start_codon:yes stop_codon:yes gene_type:complete